MSFQNGIGCLFKQLLKLEKFRGGGAFVNNVYLPPSLEFWKIFRAEIPSSLFLRNQVQQFGRIVFLMHQKSVH